MRVVLIIDVARVLAAVAMLVAMLIELLR